MYHYSEAVQGRMVPFVLHGDGAPVEGVGKAWSMSADTWSMTSLVSRGPTILFYLVLGMLWQNALADNSVEVFLNVLAWSFLWLEKGLWPRTDVHGIAYPAGSEGARLAGKPLAGGWRGTLFLVIGDLEYMSKFLKLENFNSLSPCALCKCGKRVGDPSWTDCTINGPWRTTMWASHAEWAGAHPEASILFRRLQLSGFAFYPDWMHCKHLGTDQYVYASVIVYLVSYLIEGNGEKQKYNWLMACIRAKYKEQQLPHA